MEFLRKIGSYLFLRKQTTAGEATPFNLKAMHFINKLSILLFLVAVVLLIVKVL